MRKHILSFVLVALIVLPAIGRGAVTSDGSKPKETFTDVEARISAEMNARQSEFHTFIQSKREEFSARLDAGQNELAVKLKYIKDDRRRQIVERIGSRMQSVLMNTIDRFMGTADALDEVVGRLKTRRDKAAAASYDVSSAEEAIAAGDAAIVAARTSIGGLLDKTYLIAISSDETLVVDVVAARDIMKSDLERVRSALQSGKDAVRDAREALAKIPGVDNAADPALRIATSTASSTSPAPLVGTPSKNEP